jgi:hypothetical protein
MRGQMPGGAGMVEVNVGQEEVGDVIEGVAMSLESGFQGG